MNAPNIRTVPLMFPLSASLLISFQGALGASFIVDDFNTSTGFLFEVDNDPATATRQSHFVREEVGGVFEGVRDVFFETMNNNGSATEHGTLRLGETTSGQVIFAGIDVYVDLDWGDVVPMPPVPADPGDALRIEFGYASAPLDLSILISRYSLVNYEGIPASPTPFVVEIPMTEFERYPPIPTTGIPRVPEEYSEVSLEIWIVDGVEGEFTLDSISVVPEPSAILLLFAGLGAMWIRWRLSYSLGKTRPGADPFGLLRAGLQGAE